MKPAPPGYFEGESMTRRHAFTIAAQGLGGLTGAAIVLPAVGLATPRSSTAARNAGRRSARSATSSKTYRQVVFTETPGIGDVGKTTAYVRRGSKQLGENPRR